MNLGDNRWHRKYICDKCGQEIEYIGQKGYVGINHYYKSTQGKVPTKYFDLCVSCEKLLKKWLKEKEIPKLENLLDKFEIYKEDK